MVWHPQAGAQTSAILADWCEDVFYGGERGGGKSDFQLGYQEDAALRYEGKSRGIMFRKTYNELEELQARASEIFPASGAIYKTQPSAKYPFSNCWYWPNGATVKMRYIEHERDYGRYHGHQYSHMSFDEVTEYPTPNGVLKMISCLRNAHGVPCSLRLTGNPGGRGHGWVKQRYIDTAPPYTPYLDPDSGMTRMFIPSKTSDNQVLMLKDPTYRNKIKASASGNKELEKAWLEGNWDIVSGAFFTEFRRDKHVIKPFKIPTQWTKFRAFDWGSAKPFACYWIAVADGSYKPDGWQKPIPRGALVFYREYYGMEAGKLNTGLKMTSKAVAKQIFKVDNKETTGEGGWGVADPAIFASNGGISIAEEMRREGVLWRGADNKRKAGWEQLRIRLLGDEDTASPLIYFFENCIHAIRTLPLMQHDAHDVEDIDTDMEDHAPDTIRYACMARPIIKDSLTHAPKKNTYEHLLAQTSEEKKGSIYRR